MRSAHFLYCWGEPERAPHIRDICKFCLSVGLFVGLYVHNTIIYEFYFNLRIPSIVDCSFEQYVSQTVFSIFKKHFGTNELN